MLLEMMTRAPEVSQSAGGTMWTLPRCAGCCSGQERKKKKLRLIDVCDEQQKLLLLLADDYKSLFRKPICTTRTHLISARKVSRGRVLVP